MLLAREETAPRKEPGVWPGPHLGVCAGQIPGLPSEPHCQGVGKGGLWPQPGSWAPLLRALWEQLPPEVGLKPEPFPAPHSPASVPPGQKHTCSFMSPVPGNC